MLIHPEMDLQELHALMPQGASLQAASYLKEHLLHYYPQENTTDIPPNLWQRCVELALNFELGAENLEQTLKQMQEQRKSLYDQAEAIKRAWLEQQGYHQIGNHMHTLGTALEMVKIHSRKTQSQAALAQVGLREGQKVCRMVQKRSGYRWGEVKEVGFLEIVNEKTLWDLVQGNQPQIGSLIVRLQAGGQPGKRYKPFSPDWQAAG